MKEESDAERNGAQSASRGTEWKSRRCVADGRPKITGRVMNISRLLERVDEREDPAAAAN